MNKIQRFFVVLGCAFALLTSSFMAWLSGQYTVPILMYHNVEAVTPAQLNWVSPQKFQWQMDFLKKHNYEIISLNQLVDASIHNQPVSHKSVVITFDDGYANNYMNAFPVLAKYHFPATIFIPPGKLDKEGYLTWAQLREMAANGFDVGSHTIHHVYLPSLDKEVQKDEIENSKLILEKLLGAKVALFCYPIGGFSDLTKQLLKEAGYTAACTTNRGTDRLNKDLYELKRVRLNDKDDREDYLFAKFSGYYNVFRKLRPSNLPSDYGKDENKISD